MSGTGGPSASFLARVAPKSPLSENEKLRIFSGVLFLCQHSSLHAEYPATVIEDRIVPSLACEQFRYYVDPDGVPVAFCNWAFLSAPVLEDVLATGRDLAADEFRCGELPFFYEFLAPFGHCRAVVSDLRGLPLFRGQCIPAIRCKGHGDDRLLSRVGYFHF